MNECKLSEAHAMSHSMEGKKEKRVKQEMENVCHIIKAWNTIEISFVPFLHSLRYLEFHL